MNASRRFFRKPAPQRLFSIRAALRGAGLPCNDITTQHLPDFIVALDSAGAVKHCAGLECFGRVGLLRSVLVARELRGTGQGARLLSEMERYAMKRGVRTLYLLTTTAGPFFERRGYARCERERAPECLKATAEFMSLCPSSAICLSKELCVDSVQRATGLVRVREPRATRSRRAGTR
jgi:amino-acid N-acetyltransferase